MFLCLIVLQPILIMKQLSTYKVKGSSISEAVIAMALVAICLAMATAIYSQVITSGNTLTDVVAEQKIKELAWQTEVEQSFEDDSFDFEVYKIEKRTSKPDVNGMVEVVFKVISNKNSYSQTVLINRYLDQ